MHITPALLSDTSTAPAISPAASMMRRPLLTPADVLFCALPVALFLSIVSLV